ncbi:MAG: hypothetical protein EXS05_01465 [Planctomycetaceae bacterium]|nr:hypothetical protein [Planctomycetaceae bacterium]
MPRIFVGNFDFEHELAASDKGRVFTARKAQQVSQALATAWIAIANPDDVVVTTDRVEFNDFAALAALGLAPPRFVSRWREIENLSDAELVPWGWSTSMSNLAAESGCRAAAPPMEVVRRVNSRVFRFESEVALGVNLPGAAVARSLDELQTIVAEQGAGPRGWVLKANYGMSGRESVRGRGTALPEGLCNWARTRLASSGPIVFEPLLDRVAEAGIQIDIPPIGQPHLVGVTPLLVDNAGVYRASRFGCLSENDDHWRSAVETAMAVAQRVQQLGYFGPLGIDAMRYRNAEGALQARPLQDLNARYTMGRLALGFSRILPPGWCGSWMHSASHTLRRTDEPSPAEWTFGDDDCRIVPTSPRLSGHAVMPVSLLGLARSPEILRQIELRFSAAP